MSSRPAGRAANVSRASARPHAGSVRARRDSDAFCVTALTLLATMIALYDLLVLGMLYG